jgi:hypothetical protein
MTRVLTDLAGVREDLLVNVEENFARMIADGLRADCWGFFRSW